MGFSAIYFARITADFNNGAFIELVFMRNALKETQETFKKPESGTSMHRRQQQK